MNESQPGAGRSAPAGIVSEGLEKRPVRHSAPRDPKVRRGAELRFTFEGLPVDGFAGESVAAALLAAGFRTLRESPVAGTPRGAFCWMGLCQECVVDIDGVRRPACRTPCAEGMVVRKGTIGGACGDPRP